MPADLFYLLFVDPKTRVLGWTPRRPKPARLALICTLCSFAVEPGRGDGADYRAREMMEAHLRRQHHKVETLDQFYAVGAVSPQRAEKIATRSDWVPWVLCVGGGLVLGVSLAWVLR